MDYREYMRIFDDDRTLEEFCEEICRPLMESIESAIRDKRVEAKKLEIQEKMVLQRLVPSLPSASKSTVAFRQNALQNIVELNSVDKSLPLKNNHRSEVAWFEAPQANDQPLHRPLCSEENTISSISSAQDLCKELRQSLDRDSVSDHLGNQRRVNGTGTLSSLQVKEEILWDIKFAAEGKKIFDSKLFSFGTLLWRLSFGLSSKSHEHYFMVLEPVESIEERGTVAVTCSFRVYNHSEKGHLETQAYDFVFKTGTNTHPYVRSHGDKNSCSLESSSIDHNKGDKSKDVSPTMAFSEIIKSEGNWYPGMERTASSDDGTHTELGFEHFLGVEDAKLCFDEGKLKLSMKINAHVSHNGDLFF